MKTLCIVLSIVVATFGAGPTTAATKSTKTYNGAIAYHRDSQTWGYSVNKLTARDAQTEALRQCGHERCEIVARLRNNCGAVANGPTRFTVGNRRDETGIGNEVPEDLRKGLRARCVGMHSLAGWSIGWWRRPVFRDESL
jgi:hypothetical protein